MVGDSRGLKSLAFHPQYATNGRFYVLYHDSEQRSHWSSHRLPPGHYRLHVTVPGEAPRTLSVEVVNGEDTRVRLQ